MGIYNLMPLYLLIAIICAIASAGIAARKERSVVGYFFLGLLTSVIGLVIALTMEHGWICKYCKEGVKKDALICPHCRKEFKVESAEERILREEIDRDKRIGYAVLIIALIVFIYWASTR